MNDTEYLIGSSAYDGLVDGSIQEFNMPSGITSVKEYLCFNNTALTKIDLYGATSISEAAFKNCSKVNDIRIGDAELSFIGKYAFQNLGYDRSNKSENILTLDFRKCNFYSLYEQTFGTTSNEGKSISYANIYLPKSLRTIDNNTFRYLDHVNIYFTGYAPQLLGSGVFTGYSNLKLYCFYKDLYAYKNNSNWAALTAISVGYAPASEFEAGDTLPTYDQSGHLLTWYSDASLSTVITVANGNEIYCTVSSTLGASDVTITAQDATVTVTDGTNNYDSDNPIPFGTTVTINVTPRTGYQAYILTKNGTAMASGDTFTAESGATLNVVAIYYDGEHLPIDPTLNNNSWAVIKKVVDEGNYLQYWNLGDTKEVTVSGNTYHVRVCDLTANRYTKSGTSAGNKIVFEFVECMADSAQMNSSNTNNGGFASSKRTELVLSPQVPTNSSFQVNMKSLVEEHIQIALSNHLNSNYIQQTTMQHLELNIR